MAKDLLMIVAAYPIAATTIIGILSVADLFSFGSLGYAYSVIGFLFSGLLCLCLSPALLFSRLAEKMSKTKARVFLISLVVDYLVWWIVFRYLVVPSFPALADLVFVLPAVLVLAFGVALAGRPFEGSFANRTSAGDAPRSRILDVLSSVQDEARAHPSERVFQTRV